MTRSERERLMSGFLEGSLDRTEEERFFIELASDRTMQHDLKAEQIVDRAIESDRIQGMMPWGAMRAELAGRVTLSAQEGDPTAVAQRPGPPGSATRATILGRLAPFVLLVCGVLLLVFVRSEEMQERNQEAVESEAVEVLDEQPVRTTVDPLRRPEEERREMRSTTTGAQPPIDDADAGLSRGKKEYSGNMLVAATPEGEEQSRESERNAAGFPDSADTPRSDTTDPDVNWHVNVQP